MIKTNFHTHTNFCDGKNTIEELCEIAIEKGFTALGFSSHSYFHLDEGKTLCEENVDSYLAEIKKAKEKFGDKIEIYAGIEQEYFSPPINRKFDYVIGSSHYVFKDGEYLAVDQNIEPSIREHFGGSFDAFAEAYFETVSLVGKKIKPDIIGHIDLVSKYMEQGGYEQSKSYLSNAKAAVDELLKCDAPFEMNTGAMARGFRTTPYPSVEILKMIKDGGGRIAISSDCHNKDFLDCGFGLCEEIAKSVGFDEYAILTPNGIKYKKF